MIVHKPVLLKESIDALSLKPSGVYVDCTFGMGGHSSEILEREKTAIVIAIDRDGNNKKYADELLNKYGNRLLFSHNVYSNITEVVAGFGFSKVDGILYDIGFSSMQIETPERGFSFNLEGPLDMGMGLNNLSAFDIVNTYSVDNLSFLFKTYGQERKHRKIAEAIVRYRLNKPVNTTLELADIVKSVIPYRGKTHPATLVFQAIRIATNDELNELSLSLIRAKSILNSGGRMCVITFHSLEGRVVKKFLQSGMKRKNFDVRNNPISWGQNDSDLNDKNDMISVFKKGIVPSKEEVKENRRARSAMLFVMEKK